MLWTVFNNLPFEQRLAKIAEAMDISLADFFPGTETPRDKETQKMLGELSQDEIRFLVEIKRYSSQQPRFTPYAFMAASCWTGALLLQLTVPYFRKFP